MLAHRRTRVESLRAGLLRLLVAHAPSHSGVAGGVSPRIDAMMGAVVGAAQSAAKAPDVVSGFKQRLESTHALLDDLADEVLQQAQQERPQTTDFDVELSRAIDALLRRAKRAASELSLADAEAARKTLREKELYYKLKCVRVVPRYSICVEGGGAMPWAQPHATH